MPNQACGCGRHYLYPMCETGAATHVAASGLREARVGETAAVVAEKGKEYGTKGWNFLKGVYGTVANQVEHVARDSGYKLDLGEPFCDAAPLPVLVQSISSILLARTAVSGRLILTA